MPELPEVEILRLHLASVLPGQTISHIKIHRPKSLHGTKPSTFSKRFLHHTFQSISRRGKYLLFHLHPESSPGTTSSQPSFMIHLGMTGRIFLVDHPLPLTQSLVAEWQLSSQKRLLFSDTRFFGHLTTQTTALERLGPEPWEITPEEWHSRLTRSRQAVKIKLLDQHLLAGVGNIYASEALHQAQIHPNLSAKDLTPQQSARLLQAIQSTLDHAIELGKNLTLDWQGTASTGNGIFYYGQSTEATPSPAPETFRVYDRENQACPICRTPICRLTQAQRSTYYCPQCQPLT